MKNLLLKPNNNSKKKFDITPQSAHWKYVGFKLFHLEKGDDIKDKTNFEYKTSLGFIYCIQKK